MRCDEAIYKFINKHAFIRTRRDEPSSYIHAWIHFLRSSKRSRFVGSNSLLMDAYIQLTCNVYELETN